VWRHQWEHTQESRYRDVLVTYNREDCQALKALTDTLWFGVQFDWTPHWV